MVPGDPIPPAFVSLHSPRPRALGDAVGLHVDVLSNEPDAKEGDFFSGIVVSVDVEQQTVRVLFDGEGNGVDHEDIAWNSPDIHWLTEESVRSRDDNDNHSLGDSISIVTRNGRPLTLQEALHCEVKIGADLQRGRVVSFDVFGQCIVEFDKVPIHDNATDRRSKQPSPLSTTITVKIHWKSPNLYWVAASAAGSAEGIGAEANASAKSPNKNNSAVIGAATDTPSSSPAGKAAVSSTVTFSSPAAAATAAVHSAPIVPLLPLDRPASFAGSVGWTVEVRSLEAEDEVYVGEVAAVDEQAQTLTILFAGEDGALQEEDAEVFDWGSDRLQWLEGPPAASEPVPAEPPLDAANETVFHLAQASVAGAATTAPVTPTKNDKIAEKEEIPKDVSPPKNLAEAVGYTVDVVFDYASAKVVAVNEGKQTLDVLLDGTVIPTGILPGAQVLNIPFESNIIEWSSVVENDTNNTHD